MSTEKKDTPQITIEEARAWIEEARRLGIEIKPPEPKVLPLEVYFSHLAHTPKAIIALWRVWREDSDYREAWKLWRQCEVLRRKGQQPKHCFGWDIFFRRGAKMSYDEISRPYDLFLIGFARAFGIPPLNPKSKDIEKEVERAIRRWNVGKFNRAAWTITNDTEDELSRNINEAEPKTRLRVCIEARADIGEIKEAVEAIVQEWRELGSPWKLPKVTSQAEKYDDYARAWYLRRVKKLTPIEVAREMLGKTAGRTKTANLNKVRMWIAAGKQIFDGSLGWIRGKQTPGYTRR